MTMKISRRAFLHSSGSMLGGAWLATHYPLIVAAAEHAHAAGKAAVPPAFEFLTADEARDVEAIAAQIIPSGDDGPGAREAHVVYFVDRALTTFMQGGAEAFRRGLAAQNRDCRARYPDAARFADLDEERQRACLAATDATPFFQQLRFLTIAGMFALPSYGGNRDRLGWQLIGFEDRHAYSPPFGEYDRDYPGFEKTPPERSR